MRIRAVELAIAAMTVCVGVGVGYLVINFVSEQRVAPPALIASTEQKLTTEEPRAAGSARSHFLDVQCSTARIKVTRGTRHFARDALSSPLASTP